MYAINMLQVCCGWFPALTVAVCAPAAWAQAPGSRNRRTTPGRRPARWSKRSSATSWRGERWRRIDELGAIRCRRGADAQAQSMPEPPGRPVALPAERAAGGTGVRSFRADPNTAEVIVFASLSVPEPSWRQWSLEAVADRLISMVLRGVAEGGLIGDGEPHCSPSCPQDGAGAVIDPRLFRLFRIGHGARGGGGAGGRPSRANQPGLFGGRRRRRTIW